MQAKYYDTYHEQLDSNSVRLLRVRSRTSDNAENVTIECQLTTHTLEGCPPYVALSYAWTEPQALIDDDEESEAQHRKSVMLNGESISTTANLTHALYHLAADEDSSVNQLQHYWIDALCINQSDVVERTTQVAIMQHIYSGAERVQVWLGPDLKAEAYTVREFFRALLQKYSHEDDGSDGFEAKKFEINFLHQDDECDLIRENLPPLDAPIWEQVFRFWDRGWFTRVWVKHEVALARYASFWCGEVEFTREDMVITSRFFGMSGLSESLMILRNGFANAPKYIEGRKIGNNVMRIDELQMFAKGEGFTESVDFGDAADRLTGPASINEEGLVVDPLRRIFGVELIMGYNHDATDSRDHIFAVLVLMKKIAAAYGVPELPLKADYSKSSDDVFRETTSCIIEKSGWIGILGLIHPRRRLDTASGLISKSSWVPDFSSSSPPRPLLLFEPGAKDLIQEKATLTTTDITPKVMGPQLEISAKRVGTIADIGDTSDSMIVNGNFELSASLMLKVPELINGYGKGRVDMWMDALACNSTSHPSDSDERARFRHWILFDVLRELRDKFNDGRIKRAREHFDLMPSFEILASTDQTDTLPTYAYWASILPQPEVTSEMLSHRPTFPIMHALGRRLFRLVDLNFPHCPAAMLLGVGPEDIKVGDEVFIVAGSNMPLVLRREVGESRASSKDNVQEPSPLLPKAFVVGEAYVSYPQDLWDALQEEKWERWRLL